MQFNSMEEFVSFVTTQKLPEWQRKLFKRNADAIQVHSQGQIFYKLDRLFPNEHPSSKMQRILSFESVTEASFGRAANNVNRIFKNSSYTVEASEKTLEFSNAHSFDGTNFYTWFLDNWVKWALLEDSNSRIVVYPQVYTEQTGRSPVCFVASENIRVLTDDLIVFVSIEESEVTYDLEEIRAHQPFWDQSIDAPNSYLKSAFENTYTPVIVPKVKRYVYHVFDKLDQTFYRIEQEAKDSIEYTIQEYEIKDFPVIDVGGTRGRQDVNKSFLHPFVAFGNLALLQHSQHTAVNFTYSFPRMSEIETPCDAEGCANGTILMDDLEKYPLGYKNCMACKGTGFKSAQSPYKVYKKRLDPNAMEGAEKLLAIPDVQFYTPPTGILDYSKKEWKDYLEAAEQAVYIQQRVKTGNVEAAKSKEIDRDDLYAFLSRVGQVFFSRLRFALQCFENDLVGNPVWVTVENPYSYAILSEGEAFDALKDILSSNVPIMIKGSQVDSFVNKFVSQSSPIKKFMDVLKLVDPLFYYPYLEVSAYTASGFITKEQATKHVFAFPVLQQLYFSNKELFLEDTQKIADTLETELEKYKPAPPDLKSSLLNQFNTEQQTVNKAEQKLTNAE